MSDAPPIDPGGPPEPVPEAPSRNMRALAVSVLAVQALVLLALWLLQATLGS